MLLVRKGHRFLDSQRQLYLPFPYQLARVVLVPYLLNTSFLLWSIHVENDIHLEKRPHIDLYHASVEVFLKASLA